MIDFPAEEECISQRVSPPVDVGGAAAGYATFPKAMGIEIIEHIRNRLIGIVRIGRGGLGLRRVTTSCDKTRIHGKCGQECFLLCSPIPCRLLRVLSVHWLAINFNLDIRRRG